MLTAVIVSIATVVVGLLSLVGAIYGARMATKTAVATTNNLVIYRIDKLEEKVDKHNNLIDRTYKLETKCDVFEEKFDNIIALGKQEFEVIKDQLKDVKKEVGSDE